MSQIQLFNETLTSFLPHFVQLPDKPEETAENTLKVLWFAAGAKAGAIETVAEQPLPELTSEQISHFQTLVQRRISGIPLAHLTGKQLFMNIEFSVSGNALVPRKETELLGRRALSCIQETVKIQGHATVIDVCTGCGNLPLAYAFYEPECTLFASDLSDDAIILAKENAVRLHLQHRVVFKSGDLFTPFESQNLDKAVDVISCNPPYISSGKLALMPKEIIGHEPELAFNGGPFGLNIINKVIKQSQQFLTDSGWLCMEVGEGQGNGIMNLMNKSSFFKHVEPVYDSKGSIRCIAAKK